MTIQHLTLDQIADRLGLDLIQTRTIEALTLGSAGNGRTAGARSMGVKESTFRMRVLKIREELNLHNDMSLVLLFDRIRRGETNSRAMEGLK